MDSLLQMLQSADMEGAPYLAWLCKILTSPEELNLPRGAFLLIPGVLVLLLLLRYQASSRPVFLVDFSCYRPPAATKCSFETFMKRAKQTEKYTEESLEFMEKVSKRSGVGNEAHFPEALHREPPWDLTLAACRYEAEQVMYSTVEEVLKATGIAPRQVDILIVNCSIFCPTPSLSAMIVNRFRLRSDCITYNLGGMGCSAGLLSVSLARELLQVYPNSRALIVSTENITKNVYLGNNRPMLVPACIFRVGGAGCLLSNRWQDRFNAKYKLTALVRTHAGARDDAYRCVFQEEDNQGLMGVMLSKDLMKVAGETLKTNIKSLAPMVLPYSEQLKYAWYEARRKVSSKPRASYLPNFTKAFDQICIHTGGRAVIDAMEKQLKLPAEYVNPSREVLKRFGNQSSASIWYVLAYLESTQGICRGSRTWQLSFGSGFKVNSAVWVAMRNNKTVHRAYQPYSDYAS